MTVADKAQIAGIIIQTSALIWAIWQFRLESTRRRLAQEAENLLRRDNEAKALSAQRIEIYQRLEIESNRVFEFEARHPQLVPMMKRRLAPVHSLDELNVQNEYGDRMDARQIAMIARKYYEMNCNLFEIAARLRKLDLIDADVFGSWVAWYFDTGTEWGFRALWADLRDNYTADLRGIFDPLCVALIAAWDVPHAEGRLSPVRADSSLPDVTEEEVERRRGAFYEQIGTLLACPVISGWIRKVDESQLPQPHPMAYC